MSRYIFVGGREKGFLALRTLYSDGVQIPHAYILKEDDHELEKFYPQITKFCEKKNIPYTITTTIKNNAVEIKKLKPDLIVVYGWRTIIPPSILVIPKSGCICAHESMLPKYRGFAPINWAIINGEKKVGVTLFYLNEGTDSGDIIAQQKIPVGPNDTAYEIYKKSVLVSDSLLAKYHNKIVRGKASRTKQKEREATYTCARTPDDGKISWLLPNQQIHDLIRALSHPYPGAFCSYKGERIVIQSSHVPIQKNWSGSIPGRIVRIKESEGVEVLTGKGSITIVDLEVAGKEVKSWNYFKSIKDTLS